MRITYSILFLYTLLGCTQSIKKDQYYLFINEIAKESILEKCKAIIVIPNAGCSGCIMASEQYMFNNIDKSDSVYYVLTAFNSLKELKAKYSIDHPQILINKNIIIDNSAAFEKLEVDKRYPLVIFIQNSKILDIDQFDTTNKELVKRIK